jgi:hypothetical protein
MHKIQIKRKNDRKINQTLIISLFFFLFNFHLLLGGELKSRWLAHKPLLTKKLWNRITNISDD